MKLTREVHWTPGRAYDETYGRTSIGCRFVVTGLAGSIEWWWSTGIGPERVQTRRFSREEWRHDAPYGRFVAYHWDIPRDYQAGDATDGCDLRPDGRCYWDASYIAGDDYLDLFVTKGADAVWKALEARYADWVVEIAQEVAA